MGFYDGTKLLSLKDINGNRPEIYICTSNRSAGKTTYFNRWAVNGFLKRGEQFCLVYRHKYELEQVPEKFFKDIGSLFFNDYAMTAKTNGGGSFVDLFLAVGEQAPIHCGYAVSLNSADQLKKFSHLLSDTKRMIFDEFQSETNTYAAHEVQKLISIHTSIARGQGQRSRYVPLVMISNPVSILNPYYTELGISSRLDNKTRFLRGDGFVLEQGYNESAAESLKQSAFNRAFSGSDYMPYNLEGVYLNDVTSFVEKLDGFNQYVATFKYGNKEFAIREYTNLGLMYCDRRVDKTYPVRFCLTTNDHNINYVMLQHCGFLIRQWRELFSKGAFRFYDLECKQAIITALSL